MNRIKISFVFLTIISGLAITGIAIPSAHAASGGNGGSNGDAGAVNSLPFRIAANNLAIKSLRHISSEITSNPNLSQQAKTIVEDKIEQTADQLHPSGGPAPCNLPHCPNQNP